MTLDTKDLQKLSPPERIKRLKEMEQQRKKEMGEIESLISKSLEEAKTDHIADKVAPPARSVDITQFFTQEDEESSRRREKETEQQFTVKYSAAQTPYRSGNLKTLAEDYSAVKKMLEGYVSPGSLSDEQKQRLHEIEGRLHISSYQTHANSDKMAVMMSGSREALHRIRRYAGME